MSVNLTGVKHSDGFLHEVRTYQVSHMDFIVLEMVNKIHYCSNYRG